MKVEFAYRPDGDLNEYIGNDKAREIISACRKGNFNNEYEAETRLEKYIAEKKLKIAYDWNSQECNDKIKQYIEENQEWYLQKYASVMTDLKDPNYAITDRQNEEGYTIERYYDSLKEGIRVTLTNKMKSMKPILEYGVFGGLSDDRNIAYIEYPENYPVTEFIERNNSDEDFGKKLSEKGVEFQKSSFDSGYSFYKNQTKYEYLADGVKIFAYQITHKNTIRTVVFARFEPTLLEVLEAFEGK